MGAKAKYASLLHRAVEAGAGGCGCVIVDREGREVAATGGSSHPLHHAVMGAISAVTEHTAAQPGEKRPRSEEDYLCQDCEVVTTHEPCIMCAMALVHSRVRLVAYRTADPKFGGLGGQ